MEGGHIKGGLKQFLGLNSNDISSIHHVSPDFQVQQVHPFLPEGKLRRRKLYVYN